METDTVGSEPVRTFDWTLSNGPTDAVVTAVAEELNAAPVEIPPIHSVVDGDALDSLLDTPGHVEGSTTRRIQFGYQGFQVHVDAQGHGCLYESTNQTEEAR